MTVAIQGSLDGSNWYELVAATASTSTPTVASSVISSTVAPVTYLRANVATHASTGAIDVYLVGR